MATGAQHRASSCLAAGLLLASLLAPLTAAQPWPVCRKDVWYTANSTYQSNLRQLSSTLPTNASRVLFATAAVGTFPDIAYALALCRGDSNASACEFCVATAFLEAQELCPFKKDAAVFYDDCNLHFSNENILNTTDNDPIILMNSPNVSSSVEVLDTAVGILLNATSNYAATNSSRRFATGEDFNSSNPSIYGLAQCTPDMLPADCRSCLDDIIGLTPQYLSGSQGGRIAGLRCNFRYELNKFFTGDPSLRLQTPLLAPAMAPATNNAMATPGGQTRYKNRTVLAIALPIVAVILAIITMVSLCFLKKKRSATEHEPSYSGNPEDTENINSLLLNISALRAATNNFAESNGIGEGGFGTVYKGVLPDGQEIAVKRLSQGSGQGIQELKNELTLVAKLQHRNLVRLVGICLQEHEKLIVYEYMPNRSIDNILYDPERSKELDWGKRLKIINGIARGLRYLHEDSQFKIIHRDLKASNVLLDTDYNPKISDFGLARLSGGDQDQSLVVTNHVVGTYGYMAPEYAMRGRYSMKSDVFSFGVLILEIITGRRSNGSYNFEESIDLLSFVWEHWITGTIMEIIDSSQRANAPGDLILKCVHIGLLCVQDNPDDRPTMSTVNVMLSSNTVCLQDPLKPEFFIPKNGTYSNMY